MAFGGEYQFERFSRIPAIGRIDGLATLVEQNQSLFDELACTAKELRVEFCKPRIHHDKGSRHWQSIHDLTEWFIQYQEVPFPPQNLRLLTYHVHKVWERYSDHRGQSDDRWALDELTTQEWRCIKLLREFFRTGSEAKLRLRTTPDRVSGLFHSLSVIEGLIMTWESSLRLQGIEHDSSVSWQNLVLNLVTALKCWPDALSHPEFTYTAIYLSPNIDIKILEHRWPVTRRPLDHIYLWHTAVKVCGYVQDPRYTIKPLKQELAENKVWRDMEGYRELRETFDSLEICPLEFWKEYNIVFPVLAKVAPYYLEAV
ncbi:hypothetical protein SISNIDRAFT_483984 [Sistotremastrum niveocremeum HHB9708]|uniref:Uncharacterized protein n=1 Tax=Sistotremastrum niveocremeum HHB9708 TaxID=1314777 RepID=A0A164WJQ1_9AGAM|nr:hypothetical protein SISNIDRAFT_483984 [Sistotremastrum niveocremeum HHB9708]